MVAALNSVDRAPLAALPNQQARFVGRVDAVRKYEGAIYTRIICPAVDAYSRPAVVEVRSKSRLGSKDEVVEFVASIGGYTRKAYSFTDKSTGEVVNLIPVDVTLDCVE